MVTKKKASRNGQAKTGTRFTVPNRGVRDLPVKSIPISVDDIAPLALLDVGIKGMSPLMVHAWGRKGLEMMRQLAQGENKRRKKAPQKPLEEALDACHWIGKQPTTLKGCTKAKVGFPCTAFKAATVRSAKSAGVPMTEARLMFFVEPSDSDPKKELVEIKHGEATLDERPVRLQNVAALRYRLLFHEWSASLTISYNPRKVSAVQLASWIVDAGLSNGIGEMRPGGRNSSHTFGRWTVTEVTAHEPQVDA